MRGYLTGSTETSILTQYNNGCRNYCGNPLPDGLVSSQKLPENLLTPTTKGERDLPIDLEGIVREGLMSQEDLDVSNPSLPCPMLGLAEQQHTKPTKPCALDMFPGVCKGCKGAFCFWPG